MHPCRRPLQYTRVFQVLSGGTHKAPRLFHRYPLYRDRHIVGGNLNENFGCGSTVDNGILEQYVHRAVDLRRTTDVVQLLET